MNVYLQVQNLLNTANIVTYTTYTGNPDDDDYLSTAVGIGDAQDQLDPVAFTDMYMLKLNNPSNYTRPRTIRLGVTLDFNLSSKSYKYEKTAKNTLYIFFALLAFGAQAKENVNHNGGGVTSPLQTLAYNCAVGTAQTLLDINNVKTTILNGGDMWWDLSNGP